jgi:phosphomethylpyrimidine synthase
VRISKEIREFTSGKDAGYATAGAKVTEALTSDQAEILRQRGVLSPAEVHRLASKTKSAVGADAGKAACHSDVADADNARQLQEQSSEELVQIGARG